MATLTFRAKLLIIVGTASLALAAVIVGSALSGLQATRHLADVEGRLVPKLELGPRLEREFDLLNQSLLDSVSAQDLAALEETLAIRNRIFALISGAGPELDSAAAVQLRWTIQDYYEVARGVCARSIAGETGELIVADMSRMQARRASALASIKKATGLSRRELRAGFAAVRDANERADRLRLAIGLTGLAVLIALSSWAARRMLRRVDHLSSGFARFATGDFTEPISDLADDEFGRVAGLANQMAASLHSHAEQRERNDWVSAGLREFSDEIRAEVEPEGFARCALTMLAKRARAAGAAFYVAEESGDLRLLSEFAGGGEQRGAGAALAFRAGEGLVGQAAQQRELWIVERPQPEQLRVRCGLGVVQLGCLVYLPLLRGEKSVGVIELGLLTACSDELRQLLSAVRDALVVSFLAARSRAALRELLERTQAQAEQLATQERELSLGNQELRAQREQLREANEELRSQRAALTERNAELEEARAGLQQKAEELTRVSSYKSQFLANMSHELRTPLNSMLLLSHLLGENDAANLTPKQVLHCKTIHSAGQDLLKLINQVLDLAKIESGREEIQVEEVELRDFIAYARKVIEPLSAQKKLTLSLGIAPGMPASMLTDRQRVERILTNLLGNAVKFTDRGEVSLRIGRPEPGTPFEGELRHQRVVAFTVEDSGIGIAVESRERIFAPFEQVGPPGDRRRGGSGLGLAISRESAVLLGGELDFESKPGEGSTFRCYLPERSVALAPVADVSTPALATALAKPSFAPALAESPLLLIEDDAVLVDQITAIVRARNLDVIVAASGAEGLRLAREWQPRGVILDVKLPDTDGWSIMECLRADPLTCNIPVHFVSAVDGAARGLALGAVGYLTKPATHDDLSRVVRTLLAEPDAATRVLVVEDSEAEGCAIIELLRTKGVDAQHVTSAAEALDCLARERFGCIIMDLGLPDMDGRLLLESLPASCDRPVPRVIVHTGRTLDGREKHLLESRTQAVILKNGTSNARLLEEVKLQRRPPALLDERRSAEAARLQAPLDNVKLLLAEDDMRTAYALAALLGAKGADVLVAENGREALELLAAHPDVGAVLMDIMMPEMDGYEAMRLLRGDERFRGLPVIALTARAMAGERERCLAAGANEYLTKPVDHECLSSILQTYLGLEDDAHAAERH
jgi:signal transduction histidine kinase/CheY-like chemotaxis protein/HAMP domain-containing protein